MLEEYLKAMIPSQVRLFPKLTAGRDPYHFYRWDRDSDTGSAVLRYWFWSPDHTRKYRKRVFIDEAESLLRSALGSGEITRQGFLQHCPRTQSDGGCGFAVIIAIFEYLGLVRHTSERGVYAILSADRARRVLEA